MISSPKPKTQSKPKKRKPRSALVSFLIGAGVAVGLAPGILIAFYQINYFQRVYPGVSVAGRAAEKMTLDQLTRLLKAEGQAVIAAFPLQIQLENSSYILAASEGAVVWEIEETARMAVAWGRQGGVWERLEAQWQAWHEGVDIPIQTKINDDWLNYHADQIAQLVDVPRVQSILEVVDLPNGTATVSATMGTPGLVLDRTDFRNQIRAAMFGMEPGPIKSRLREEPVGVTERDLAKAQGRAIKLLTKKLFLSTDEGLEEKIWELSGRDLVGFVSIAGGFDEKLLAEYLTGVAETVNRPPQNALFQFDQTQQKVVEFAPAKDGLTLDRNGTTALMAAALTMLEDKAETEPVRVVMRRTEPEISLATVNDLGIIEHLGRGESTYFGSIASRVHNVRLASERINGTLIEPGEEFSFNEVVGEISGATGYKQAYVIIGGKTELGDGGGVCQVSTTIFRAALLAGLPITDRRAHAYRVGYYEQDVKAGIDATVYAPYTDFKFLNDTPAYLLIQTMVDEPNRHLIFDIYGTSDGRTSEISNHTVCCITPPPPDVFVDDPTLPVGQEKQIEYAVAGAKARFDYRVTRGGEIIFEKTFHSNYKAWASVYLRGTMGL